MKKIFLLFAMLGILAGCKQDEPSNTSITTKSPVAEFTYQIKDKTVTFSNQSTDATTFEWSFGDGNKSNEKDPSHSYAAEGAYQVTLTASNETGSGTKTKTVTLLEEFKANFTVKVLDDGVTIQCTDKTVNATKWSWDFGDKKTSTQQNPKHTYSVEKENTPLLFTISLTATSSSGKTASAAAMVTIIKQASSSPTADFYYMPQTPKANEAVSFYNSSKMATSYSWKFGDGTTSTESSPKHTYTKVGTYTVSLTASNGKQSDTKTQTITVSENKPSVSKVTVTAYCVSTLKWKDGNNSDWDLTNGPDIYIKEIYKGSSKLSIAEDVSKREEDVTEAMLPYQHNVSWELTDLTATYTFKMYDYDPLDPDDLMASFKWNVSDKVSKQPSVVILEDSGCTILFSLKWE